MDTLVTAIYAVMLVGAISLLLWMAVIGVWMWVEDLW